MMSVTAYRLASTIHWSPRARAVAAALDNLAATAGNRPGRVLDVGAGLGQLAQVASQQGLEYFGLEPDTDMLAYAERHNRALGATFRCASAAMLNEVVRPGDVVVLNGVAHHLDDTSLHSCLAAAANAAGLVICDHWRDQAATVGITRWLQNHDKGRHVRSHEFFSRLPGFACCHHEQFWIGPVGLRLWSYFCNAYRPTC